MLPYHACGCAPPVTCIPWLKGTTVFLPAALCSRVCRLVEADRLMWQQRNPVYTALAAVEPDSSLHLPQYMLRIGVRGLSAGPRVMVRLCRYTESEDTCTV